MSATDVAVNLIYEEATHNAEHCAQATGTLSSTGFTGAPGRAHTRPARGIWPLDPESCCIKHGVASS